MQENKNFILILLALLVLGALGFYFVSSDSSSEVSDSAETTEMAKDDAMMDDDAMMADKDSDAMMDKDSMMMKEDAPEGAMVYAITDGTASYTVSKGWLSKAAEDVTGTTDAVSGEGWMDPETGALYVMGNVDLTGLDSGSGTRDGDVQDLLEATTASVVLDLETSTIEVGTPFEVEAPVMVTLNGQENELTAAVSGTVTEEGFTATGTMSGVLSDFGIQAPSIADLYSVADEFSMGFEVNGTLETI